MSRRRLRIALAPLLLIGAGLGPFPPGAPAAAATVPTVGASTSSSPALARGGATSRDRDHGHDHGRRLVNQRLSGRPSFRVRGRMAPYVVDRAHSSSTRYVLQARHGHSYVLDMPASWEFSPRDRVVAQLVDTSGAAYAVASTTVLSSGESAEPLVATPKPHKTYLAVATNTGAVPDNDTVQAEVGEARTHWAADVPAAISSFADSGNVVRYSSSVLSAANCDIGMVATTNIDQAWNEAAGKFPGVSFSGTGNHLVLLVSDECQQLTTTTGLGSMGSNPAQGGKVIAYAAADQVGSVAHELGHNLGLNHAGVQYEYDDAYSVMGNMAESGHLPALPTAARVADDLTAAGEVTPVDGAVTTTLNLSGRGESAGVRGLDVRDPVDGKHYYLDYRSGTGVDADALYAAEGGFDDYWHVFDKGVTVTTLTAQEHTVLRVNGPPEKPHGAFGAGQFFITDSAAVKVTVLTTGATATVRIESSGLSPWTSAPNPVVSGVPKVGNTLTVSPGAWSPTPASFSYRWFVDGELTDVTEPSFALGEEHVGSDITAEVTAMRTGYPMTTRSTTVGPVASELSTFSSSPTVAIVGSPTVGSTLTPKLSGAWFPAPDAIEYEWTLIGADDSEDLRSTQQITLTGADVGKTVYLSVRAEKSGYESGVVDALEVGPVTAGPPQLSGPTPTISGTPKVGRRLTVRPGSWPSGTSLRRQWYANGVALAGKTATRLRLTKGLRGRLITVSVTGTKSGFAPTTMTSAPRGPVK